MKRFKVIGSSAVMAMAITALAGVPSAFAEFHSEKEETALQATGTGGNQVFTGSLSGTKFTLVCSNVTYTGISTNFAFKAWGGSPAFSNCTAGSSGGEKTTVTTSGCLAGFYDSGEMSLLNNGGESCGGISWTMGACVVKIPAQVGLKNIAYSTLGAGSKREILAKAALGKIKYQFVSTPLCPISKVSEDGTYQGEWKVKGTSTVNGLQVGVWVD